MKIEFSYTSWLFIIQLFHRMGSKLDSPGDLNPRQKPKSVDQFKTLI